MNNLENISSASMSVLIYVAGIGFPLLPVVMWIVGRGRKARRKDRTKYKRNFSVKWEILKENNIIDIMNILSWGSLIFICSVAMIAVLSDYLVTAFFQCGDVIALYSVVMGLAIGVVTILATASRREFLNISFRDALLEMKIINWIVYAVVSELAVLAALFVRSTLDVNRTDYGPIEGVVIVAAMALYLTGLFAGVLSDVVILYKVRKYYLGRNGLGMLLRTFGYRRRGSNFLTGLKSMDRTKANFIEDFDFLSDNYTRRAMSYSGGKYRISLDEKANWKVELFWLLRTELFFVVFTFFLVVSTILSNEGETVDFYAVLNSRIFVAICISTLAAIVFFLIVSLLSANSEKLYAKNMCYLFGETEAFSVYKEGSKLVHLVDLNLTVWEQRKTVRTLQAMNALVFYWWGYVASAKVDDKNFKEEKEFIENTVISRIAQCVTDSKNLYLLTPAVMMEYLSRKYGNGKSEIFSSYIDGELAKKNDRDIYEIKKFFMDYIAMIDEQDHTDLSNPDIDSMENDYVSVLASKNHNKGAKQMPAQDSENAD